MDKKGLLIVSFGTSYQDALESNIIPVEAAIAAAFPEYEMRRAFSSRKIVRKLKARDGVVVDGIESAMDRMIQDGFTDLLVQPTFVIHGFEFDELMTIIESRRNAFRSVRIGHPLLNRHEDYVTLINGLKSVFPVDRKEEAFVFMGHGTEHFANASYPALEHYFHGSGLRNVFLGTVEGYPDLDVVRENLKAGGFHKATLAPLMLVAGDHAKNDMAGDEEDSWKSILEEDGLDVKCVLDGLGNYPFIRDMFVAHARDAE